VVAQKKAKELLEELKRRMAQHGEPLKNSEIASIDDL